MKKVLVLLSMAFAAQVSFGHDKIEFTNISRLPEDSRLRYNCENSASFRMLEAERFILEMACKDLNEQFDRCVYIFEKGHYNENIVKDYMEKATSIAAEVILPVANSNMKKQEQEFTRDLAKHMVKQKLNN